MKKRLLGLMLSLLCLSSGAIAQKFEYSKELLEAKSFLVSKGVDTSENGLEVALLTEKGDMVLFYNEECFVLTASEKYFDYLDTPILAYSLEGGFKEEDLVYEKIFLLHSYAVQLKELKQQNLFPSSHSSEERKQEGLNVKPLLGNMRWGTGYPFNIYCPASSASPGISTQASSYGVAMAQVMKYHEYPVVGRSQFSYDVGMGVSLDFSKVAFDWGNMRSAYDATATEEEMSAVAKLIVSTSIAAGTRFDYNRSFSSADYIVRKGFVNHFRYSPRCLVVYSPTPDEVLRYAYQELAARRPFIGTIHFPQYGRHSFVCDGCDGNYLHLNMGMHGVANGYYRILGADDTFSSLIVGIEPDKNAEITKEVVVKKVGTLPQLLSDEEKTNVRSLSIKGKLNNEDVILIRQMAGALEGEGVQVGNLMKLDLSEATFVTDKKSYYMSKSAVGYSATAHRTTYKVSSNNRGYYNKTPVNTKHYSFNFNEMTDKKWKEFCSLGLNKGKGFLFVKDGDKYKILFHTQKGIISRNMFKDCMNLQEIILPKKTYSVEDDAFKGCRILEEVACNYKDIEVKDVSLRISDTYDPSKKKKISIVDAVAVRETVFQVVEEAPEFPGGMAELMKYLQENIKYPTICQEQGIQGRVIVQFIVEKDGSLSDIQVTKSVNPYLDKEALRVVSTMPKWKAGRQKGKPVRVRYTLPVTFKFNL